MMQCKINYVRFPVELCLLLPEANHSQVFWLLDEGQTVTKCH